MSEDAFAQLGSFEYACAATSTLPQSGVSDGGRPAAGTELRDARRSHRTLILRFEPPNDIEFSGEKEGAQRLTPSPLQ